MGVAKNQPNPKRLLTYLIFNQRHRIGPFEESNKQITKTILMAKKQNMKMSGN
jgi:hypothetical protein